jgi:hypothetical protein
LPSQGEGAWIFWIRRVKWLFVAILAPEVVVFIAFQQFIIAYLFLKKLKEMANTPVPKDGDQRVDWGFDIT